MIKKLPIEVWAEFKSRMPKNRNAFEPALPANLAYRGKLDFKSDYVPTQSFLDCLRNWLAKQHESSVYYFLTETTGDEDTDFEVSANQLTNEALSSLNRGNENAIVGKGFDWAIFIDDEGYVHVAGNASLFDVLNSEQGFA